MKKSETENLKLETENPKQYYKNLISRHKVALCRARELIETLLDKLEKEINRGEAGAKDTQLSSLSTHPFVFGEKESASSIVVKLTTILLKLIPLEQEIARTDLTKADLMELEELSIKTEIPEEDLQIIERYIERYNEEKGNNT